MNHNKLVALVVAVALAVIAIIVFIVAGPASAHDAPPSGQAFCTNTEVWAVKSGYAVTENTSGSPVVVTITSTAGTVTQTDGNVTGDGQKVSFNVDGIPVAVASIVITSTTTWDNGAGVDTHTTVIDRPSSNCTQDSVPVASEPSLPKPPITPPVPSQTTTVPVPVPSATSTQVIIPKPPIVIPHPSMTNTKAVPTTSLIPPVSTYKGPKPQVVKVVALKASPVADVVSPALANTGSPAKQLAGIGVLTVLIGGAMVGLTLGRGRKA